MSKFSVIIPLYNKEKDIKDTLNSVFNQTFTDYEIIIVDDGSTDNSLQVVKQLNHEKIKLFTKNNEGVALTRNFAVTKANYEHIVFLDADDYWYPFHLENINDLVVKHPSSLWYATAFEKQHHANFRTSMISPILKKGEQWQGIVENYFENSLIDCLAWTSAVCMKKGFFNSLNGFDFTITHGAGEDTDLWLRAAIQSPLVFSNKISARHNLDGSNRISHTPTLKRDYMKLDKYEEASKSNIYLKKYLDLNRYSFGMQHKMSKDYISFNKYVQKINLNSLNKKQRFLLKQPRSILLLILKVKILFENMGFRLSSFK